MPDESTHVPQRAAAPAPAPRAEWRERLYTVIFESDTAAGRTFDLLLLAVILLSVAAVMLESIAPVRAEYGRALHLAEWTITILFTLEYVLRLVCVRDPWRYARSFYGIVDLLAVLPTYVSLLVPGSQALMVVRALRLLRILRIFKLRSLLEEANYLLDAIRNSRNKVLVFLGTVLVLVVILGSVMYAIEGESNGFTNIPLSIYWAIVTLTTVGYGDIAPQTVAGKFVASVVMILGYSILAVPSGIVTAEVIRAANMRPLNTRRCPTCLSEGHSPTARYCQDCGALLEDERP